jgi:FtsZ-binding cell division protein ZapB
MDSLQEKLNNNDNSKGVKNKMRFTKDAIKGKKFHMDSIDQEIDDSASPLVQRLSSKIDEAVHTIDVQEIELQDKTKGVDTLKAKVDGFEKEIEGLKKDNEDLKNPDSEHNKKVLDSLVKLDRICEDNGIKTDGLTFDQKRTEVIKKTDEAYKADGKSVEYINARFDHACVVLEKLKKDGNVSKNISVAGSDKKADQDDDPRQNYVDSVNNPKKEVK